MSIEERRRTMVLTRVVTNSQAALTHRCEGARPWGEEMDVLACLGEPRAGVAAKPSGRAPRSGGK